MRKLRSGITWVLLLAILAGLLSSCAKAPEAQPPARYTDYREIPGVTRQEIEAVEALREQYDTIVFGMNFSTDAFFYEDGSIGGFSRHLCDWMSELFGIPFEPRIYEWNAMIEGLTSREIHLTNELTATPERKEQFIMSGPVSERSLQEFRLKGSESLGDISLGRKLNYGFLQGSTSYGQVQKTSQYEFTPVFMDDCNQAAKALLAGEIDAFFENSPSAAYFNPYMEIRSREYTPLQYQSASFATGDPGIKPIIDVMQRLFTEGDLSYYMELTAAGALEYRRFEFSNRLTEEEKQYIQEHIAADEPVYVAKETDNYPVSFYNSQDKEWQGIAVDVLNQVQQLSGLRFESISKPEDQFSGLLAKVEAGEASLITELIQTEERSSQFLWSGEPYCTDYYALLSRSDKEELSINQMLFAKVGLVENTAYAQMFREWFPNHTNYVYYRTLDEVFDALESGDIDLFMATHHLLLSITHYMENPGFKVNISFEYVYESEFGFNKDEVVLMSIVNKAQQLIDTEAIEGHWTRRVFDYRRNLAQQKIPLLVGGVVLLALVLAFALLMLRKNYKMSLSLEDTVRKRTGELQVQTVAAQAASRTKSEFLARMSHEIRTPLNAVIGMAQVAKKEAEQPKTVRAVEQIITSSSHLLGILNDVLDMSKIESGKFQIASEPFRLHAAMEEVALIFDQRCQDMALHFATNCAQLPDLRVVGDKLRLKQVLINLLGNAVKFTKTLVFFEVALVERTENTVRLRFEVRDDGIGMSEEQMGKLFVAFEQADSSIATRFGGTGLGLAISQSLIQQMGGKITVASRPDQGAAFTFELLMDLLGEGETAEDQYVDETPDLTGRRILLAEDVEVNRVILQELLAETGVKIDEAVNGRKAVELFASSAPGRYDLVFMDIQMPEMDGYAAASGIRALDRPDARSVPIVAMTANAYQEDIQRAMDAGMNAHLSKPLDITEMMKLLARFLGDRGGAQK